MHEPSEVLHKPGSDKKGPVFFSFCLGGHYIVQLFIVLDISVIKER